MAEPAPLFTALTRIADLADRPFDVEPRPFAEWRDGDYVAGRVEPEPGRCYPVELATGRPAEVLGGERLVSALGVRRATLEVVGDWRAAAEEGGAIRLQVLSGGGILGRATSVASSMGRLIPLRYLGHAVRGGRVLRMADFARPALGLPYARPTVAVIGTSMSSGKTTAARVLIRRLAERGRRVVAAKLTGAGRYRDALSMRDAGAVEVFDFVDAGLPSTACPPEVCRAALPRLLGAIEAAAPDVVVVEAGASPLEGYNVGLALEAVRAHTRFTVLAATDPFAVVGVRESFPIAPDLVVGFAASTSAGVELVRRLSGLPALDLLDRRNDEQLDRMLDERLGAAAGGSPQA
jgi:hypothetical protein